MLGTRNVLEACTKAGTVKRVVLTSSFAAIVNPGHPDFGPDAAYNDAVWNVSSLPNAAGEWTQAAGGGPGMHAYRYSKILAEKTAWDMANAHVSGHCFFAVAIWSAVSQETFTTF